MEEELRKVKFPLFKKTGVKEQLTNKTILLDHCYLFLHLIYLTLHITQGIWGGGEGGGGVEGGLYTVLVANTVIVLIKFRMARWHNLFLYLNLFLFSISSSLPFPLLFSFLEVISFLLSATLLLVFPIPFLPPLSGPFGVGTTVGWMKVAQEDDMHLQFLHNHHIHLPPHLSSEREITMQVWYPVDKEEYGKGKRIGFWWPAAPHVFPHLLKIFKMPILLVLHLLLGESNAVEGVKMSGKYEKYPLLISSHGFYGFKNDRSFLIEQLASWGFIVIGIDHIGDCSLAVSHSSTQQSIPFFSYLDENDNEREIRHKGLIFRSSDLFYLLNSIHSVNLTSSFPTPFISPANQLNNENNKTLEMLKGRVNMEKVGCFGHSYGGATSIYMALANDDRIKCVVCFDPWAWPLFPSPSLLSPKSTSIPSIPPLHRSSNSTPSIIPPEGVIKVKEEVTKESLLHSPSPPQGEVGLHRSIIPMLFINSEVWQSASLQKDIRQLIISNISAEGSLSVILKGTDHHNFDDLPFFGAHFILRLLGNFIGPIDPLRAYDVMSFLALKFIYLHFYNFDQFYENNFIAQCQNYIEIEKEYM